MYGRDADDKETASEDEAEFTMNASYKKSTNTRRSDSPPAILSPSSKTPRGGFKLLPMDPVEEVKQNDTQKRFAEMEHNRFEVNSCRTRHIYDSRKLSQCSSEQEYEILWDCSDYNVDSFAPDLFISDDLKDIFSDSEILRRSTDEKKRILNSRSDSSRTVPNKSRTKSTSSSSLLELASSEESTTMPGLEGSTTTSDIKKQESRSDLSSTSRSVQHAPETQEKKQQGVPTTPDFGQRPQQGRSRGGGRGRAGSRRNSKIRGGKNGRGGMKNTIPRE